MSEPIDLAVGWQVLTTQSFGAEPFNESPACRAVFDRLPEILRDLLGETASPEKIADARLRIALDADATDALRDAGFRFAEPPSEDIPFMFIVNGNDAQRNAAVLHHAEHKLPIAGLLSTWPQTLVWFAKR